ncbi:uncharacterized protein METZ01_LOCUS489251, partial [marine metagenome]
EFKWSGREDLNLRPLDPQLPKVFITYLNLSCSSVFKMFLPPFYHQSLLTLASSLNA